MLPPRPKAPQHGPLHWDGRRGLCSEALRIRNLRIAGHIPVLAPTRAAWGHQAEACARKTASVASRPRISPQQNRSSAPTSLTTRTTIEPQNCRECSVPSEWRCEDRSTSSAPQIIPLQLSRTELLQNPACAESVDSKKARATQREKIDDAVTVAARGRGAVATCADQDIKLDEEADAEDQ